MFIGLRFDASAIGLINSLFILLASLPIKLSTAIRRNLNTLWIITNSIFLYLMIGDVEYFSFNNERLQYHNFLIASDIKDQGLNVIIYYLPMFLLAISPLFILSFISKKLLKKKKRDQFKSRFVLAVW